VNPAPASYRNWLSISPLGKAIPYAGTGEPRPDGGANHGFKDLKGRPERLDEVPEAHEDRALAELMRTINARHTGVFSIASMSSPEGNGGGLRHSGYLEIAFNSRHQVEEPANYFALFLRFDRLLAARAFDHPVEFEWVLCPAHFSAGDVAGWSIAIHVRTAESAGSSDADSVWAAAMEVLRELFAAVPEERTDPMYGPRAAMRSADRVGEDGR
jgi:hypothetical protein